MVMSEELIGTTEYLNAIHDVSYNRGSTVLLLLLLIIIIIIIITIINR
jgi:hypothetical protein